MSTEATVAPRYATLIRGRYFDAKGKVWDRDKGAITHPVTPETEAYLAENGVDIVTVEGEELRRPKFEFSDKPPSSGDDEAQAAPRARRRS